MSILVITMTMTMAMMMSILPVYGAVPIEQNTLSVSIHSFSSPADMTCNGYPDIMVVRASGKEWCMDYAPRNGTSTQSLRALCAKEGTLSARYCTGTCSGGCTADEAPMDDLKYQCAPYFDSLLITASCIKIAWAGSPGNDYVSNYMYEQPNCKGGNGDRDMIRLDACMVDPAAATKTKIYHASSFSLEASSCSDNLCQTCTPVDTVAHLEKCVNEPSASLSSSKSQFSTHHTAIPITPDAHLTTFATPQRFTIGIVLLVIVACPGCLTCVVLSVKHKKLTLHRRDRFIAFLKYGPQKRDINTFNDGYSSSSPSSPNSTRIMLSPPSSVRRDADVIHL
eukprot:TRINITY_DN4878_c0_g1_i1.p1 TRINITY_DN4878_c0_g1~~TRINITY_DN4878_c0_g1_i1.p1  ORF type:complete len:348 (-),score=26.15 TRINITY_DN4878_c0_g1_i1:62-1075(-)